jgi:hypothetical protein
MWKHFYVTYLLFLSKFNETWIYSTDFRKKLKYKILSNSVQFESTCSMHMDRHDMPNKLIHVEVELMDSLKFRNSDFKIAPSVGASCNI